MSDKIDPKKLNTAPVELRQAILARLNYKDPFTNSCSKCFNCRQDTVENIYLDRDFRDVCACTLFEETLGLFEVNASGVCDHFELKVDPNGRT